MKNKNRILILLTLTVLVLTMSFAPLTQDGDTIFSLNNGSAD